MTEVTKGLKEALKNSGTLLAVIYTIGHIAIASICNYVITGAALDLAAVDAIVEPIINGVWFWVLHKLLFKKD